MACTRAILPMLGVAGIFACVATAEGRESFPVQQSITTDRNSGSRKLHWLVVPPRTATSVKITCRDASRRNEKPLLNWRGAIPIGRPIMGSVPLPAESGGGHSLRCTAAGAGDPVLKYEWEERLISMEAVSNGEEKSTSLRIRLEISTPGHLLPEERRAAQCALFAHGRFIEVVEFRSEIDAAKNTLASDIGPLTSPQVTGLLCQLKWPR